MNKLSAFLAAAAVSFAPLKSESKGREFPEPEPAASKEFCAELIAESRINLIALGNGKKADDLTWSKVLVFDAPEEEEGEIKTFRVGCRYNQRKVVSARADVSSNFRPEATFSDGINGKLDGVPDKVVSHVKSSTTSKEKTSNTVRFKKIIDMARARLAELTSR